jgi:hypothetical protein
MIQVCEKLGYPVGDLEFITCLYNLSILITLIVLHITWSHNCCYGSRKCNFKNESFKTFLKEYGTVTSLHVTPCRLTLCLLSRELFKSIDMLKITQSFNSGFRCSVDMYNTGCTLWIFSWISDYLELA